MTSTLGCHSRVTIQQISSADPQPSNLNYISSIRDRPLTHSGTLLMLQIRRWSVTQLRPRAARALSCISSPSNNSIRSPSRIKTELLALADPKYAVGITNYFKSDYSQGDIFVGLKVPQCRAVVRAHIHETTQAEVADLLYDARHELRKAGGIFLVEAFKAPHKSTIWLLAESSDAITSADTALQQQQQRQRVVEFYLEHLACFDNWDLVDITSYKILGAWMIQNHLDTINQFCEQIPEPNTSQHAAIDIESEQSQLASAIQVLPQWYQKLLTSTDFWETRVSIVLLLGIRKEKVDFAIHICKWHLLRLLGEDYEQRIKGERFADNDLVHKACGWVLRECGRGDRAKLLEFLERYATLLPRTTLQYATEHLDRKLAKSLSSQGMLSKSSKRRRVSATASTTAEPGTSEAETLA